MSLSFGWGHAGQILRGQQSWEARAERLLKAVVTGDVIKGRVVLERTDSGRICRTYDQLHVGTMRVKHGAWISVLGGGVEGVL